MYRIKASCSGCHTCELACPMGAVYFDGPHNQIDRDLCVECGLCQTLCPTCSIYDDADRAAPPTHDKLVRECDVAVCGGGTGLVAAVRAAQLGKKVILLEKAARVGGNTDLAHGFFPVYTRLNAEKGFPDVREEAVRDLSARTGGVVGEDLMRTAVYGSGEFFDWLLDFPGARDAFEVEARGEKRELGPMYGPAVLHFKKRILNRRSTDSSIGPGWAGTFVRQAMLEAIPREKLDVEILLRHEVKHLLTDEAGRVTGVLALDPGGETEIRCKTVILATGGFGGSDEKLERYGNFFDVDREVVRFSVPSDTGDAIDLLRELGVEPPEDRLFVSMFGPTHHPYSYPLFRLIEEPSCLSVDLTGKRWQDESGGLYMGRLNIAGHPKEAQWGLFSQSHIDDVMYRYLSDPTLEDEVECYKDYQTDLDREQTYRPFAPVRKADSIGALAEELGIDPDVLCRTVDRYNHFCRQGVDEEFGKDRAHLVPLEGGPYYAIYGQRFSEAAMGGVMVNDKCQALGTSGDPIPGLYAIGDASSAMHRRGELAVVSELTWAVASAFRSAVHCCQETEGSV